MNQPYSHILSPIRIGNVLFKNRIFAGPTALHALSNGSPFPSEAAIAHFAGRAKAGAACVTCSGASILPFDPEGKKGVWDIYNPLCVNVLAQLARRIQFFGAKASMELGVSGIVTEGKVVSAGAPTIWGAPGKEMTREDIDRISSAYAVGAEVMLKAGFDMVLLHFGHGLQVGQFLSPLTNKRTDEYGGSLENRARFAIEIIDRIRARVGRQLLIEVRISGTEYEPGGITVEEAIAFTRMIEDKIDLIHVSAGMHGPKWMTTTHPCGFLPATPNIFLAEAFKKAGLRIPVSGIGGVQDLGEAEAILTAGRADVLYSVRGFIADTELMQRAYEDRPEDVVPCVKCMRCHDSVVYGNHFSCTVNPVIGIEHALPKSIAPAKRKKRVAVVGGGPAGMKSAILLSERGHDVTLYEKSVTLGGKLQFADFVSFKYPLKKFKDYLVGKAERSDIRLCLKTEATPEYLAGQGYDVILVAVGANPIVPPISGLAGAGVIPATKVYGKESELAGKMIAVIGGGEVGCETALHLAKCGLDTTVLEMRDAPAPDALPTHRTELLNEINKTPNLHILTDVRCTGVTSAGVACTGKDGAPVFVPADLVVLAAGMRPDAKVVDSYLVAAPQVIPIGDCIKAATVEQAMRTAFDAANGI